MEACVRFPKLPETKRVANEISDRQGGRRAAVNPKREDNPVGSAVIR